MHWRAVCKLGRRLPGVQVGNTYDRPALAIHGAIVARLLDDKRSISVKVDPGQRSALCAANPAAFAVTDELRNYAMMAVHLPAVGPDELWPVLVESWRRCVPPHVAATFDGDPSPP